MKYEEYLQTPEVHRVFDSMFEEQRNYYKLRSKDYGLSIEDSVLYSIKLAIVSTDLYFTGLFNNNKK